MTIEDYVHRIGRTGRAGATGLAISFFTEKHSRFARELVVILTEAKQPVPPELLALVRGGGGGSGATASKYRSSSGGRGGGFNDRSGRGGRGFSGGSYPPSTYPNYSNAGAPPSYNSYPGSNAPQGSSASYPAPPQSSGDSGKGFSDRW